MDLLLLCQKLRRAGKKKRDMKTFQTQLTKLNYACAGRTRRRGTWRPSVPPVRASEGGAAGAEAGAAAAAAGAAAAAVVVVAVAAGGVAAVGAAAVGAAGTDRFRASKVVADECA
jgi:hypothetical protein